MDCKDVRRELTAFIDGCLAPRDIEQIADHLSSCSLCRAAYELEKKLWSSLSLWADVEPSEDFEEKFWRRIKAESEQWPQQEFLLPISSSTDIAGPTAGALSQQETAGRFGISGFLASLLMVLTAGWKRKVSLAVIILLVFLAAAYYQHVRSQHPGVTALRSGDVVAHGGTAMVSLPDGRKVVLSETDKEVVSIIDFLERYNMFKEMDAVNNLEVLTVNHRELEKVADEMGWR